MRKLLKTFAMIAVLTVGIMAQAIAGGLVEYKASGAIGEMPNGLVGKVMTSVSTDVDRVVDEINEERLRKYEDIAAKNGLSLSKVQALAGEKLINQTPGGQYYQSASGTWVKK